MTSIEARVESVHTMSGPVLDLRAVEILSSLDELALPAAVEDEDDEAGVLPALTGPGDGT